MVGDAELDRTLLDTGMTRAKAVIGATNSDLCNLAIGLSAHALNPGVRVVLRIVDQELASNTAARLSIDFASSTSHLSPRRPRTPPRRRLRASRGCGTDQSSHNLLI